jgi:tricarballylate dehydrogenase
MQRRSDAYDIIVIGCGAAGLAAALSAAETAQQRNEPIPAIAVLERAPREERGGNTRWTTAYLRLENEDRVADRFVEDMLEFSEGRSDSDYIRTLAEMVPQTMRWARDHGVVLEALPTMFLTANRPRYQPVGGGKAIVETLAACVEAQQIPILYRTTAQRLVADEEGVLAGVEVRDETGRLRVLGARAIIIASGGFEGNPEMLAAYIGRHVHHLPTIAPGGQFNKGEGIRMALAYGAKAAGQWDLFHAEPIDPRSRRAEAVVMIFPYGILVNKHGKRFLDEGAGTVDESYEQVARTIFYEQDDQIAYLILDAKMWEIPGYERAVLTDQAPVQADSIAGLAERLGIDAQDLVHTVATFNAATLDDTGRFTAFQADGLATNTDLVPRKSNWARPIDKPPYLAYPIVCSIVFTFGGIGTNQRAEVLSADEVPIPGLYAAGEATGLYFHKYPGATSVLHALTFGRIAGQQALQYLETHAKRGQPVQHASRTAALIHR